MFSSFSLIFLSLPAPLKVAIMAVGGLFWVGAHSVEVPPVKMEAQPLEKAEVVPAKPVRPIPAEPAVGVGKAYVISVRADGSCQIEGKKVTEAELIKTLKATAQVEPKPRVLIVADKMASHKMVMNLVKHCKNAGLTNVSFATKPIQPKAP